MKCCSLLTQIIVQLKNPKKNSAKILQLLRFPLKKGEIIETQLFFSCFQRFFPNKFYQQCHFTHIIVLQSNKFSFFSIFFKNLPKKRFKEGK